MGHGNEGLADMDIIIVVGRSPQSILVGGPREGSWRDGCESDHTIC